MIRQKLFLPVLMLTITFGSSVAGKARNPSSVKTKAASHVYYVSPKGNDNSPGTEKDPWKTLVKASTAKAGDTVIFLSGKYAGVLQPQNSGKEGAPITFRGTKSGTVTLVGKAEDTYNYAILIKGKQYIHIEGFHIAPQNPKFGRWLKIDSTTPTGKCINDKNPGDKSGHIEIKNMVMEKAFGKGGGGASIPFIVRNADQVQVKNSVLRLFEGGDMAWFQCNNHVLYQGNSISYTGHSPTAFSAFFRYKSNNYIVIRGNVFHAGWSRPFETFGDRHVLFENNIVVHGYHGGFSAGPEAKLILDHGIFRFNRIYRNFGSPINIHYMRLQADAKDTYLYNNIFADNYSDGVNINNVMTHYVFKNNIFANNDAYGGNRQLIFGGNASNSKYIRNVFWGGGAKEIFNYTNQAMTLGTPPLRLSLKDVQSAGWETKHGKQFIENINENPQFVDPKNHNYALKSSSPLIDAGRALTHTVNSGSGKIIKVKDANYFYEGYDIKGEIGDLITVGTASQQARVVKADAGSNTLTLNRSVHWKAGDPVSLPWSGKAPDIGVYEDGNHSRASVQIKTNPFAVRPHQPVQFQATVHGISQPVSYHWQFGDGTEADGKAVNHHYNKPFVQLKGGAPHGYPVFLKVTDVAGHIYRAASYVEFHDPENNAKPLVLINFNANNHPLHGEPNFENSDGNSWWRIYHTRPKTDIGIKFQDNGNGVGHFTAPQNNYSAHAEIYPAQWNIDRYPFIKFRYRLAKNMPIVVSLRAFSTTKQERQVYVAAAPNANPDANKIVAKNKLLDDDQWHTLTIDARSIRNKFPNVQLLQEFYIGAINTAKMRAGDGYYLDDFRILPKSKK